MSRLASVLDLAYNRDIEKFEDLIDLHGVGPRTLKALAVAGGLHGDSTRLRTLLVLLLLSAEKMAGLIRSIPNHSTKR